MPSVKQYVISYDGEGKYHKLVLAEPSHPREWIAKCGWRFGMSDHVRAEFVPYETHCDRICDRCLRALRKEHMVRTLTGDPAKEQDSDSSSSSAC